MYVDFTNVAASNTATLMTSQTHNILVLILYSKLMRNIAALAVFNTI